MKNCVPTVLGSERALEGDGERDSKPTKVCNDSRDGWGRIDGFGRREKDSQKIDRSSRRFARGCKSFDDSRLLFMSRMKEMTRSE